MVIIKKIPQNPSKSKLYLISSPTKKTRSQTDTRVKSYAQICKITTFGK